MKKRSKLAGDKRGKARPRKVLKRKGQSATPGMPRRVSAHAAQETEVIRLTRKLDDALKQHAAVSEVLRVISQSNAELQSILQDVAKTAARLCRSDGASIFQLESGVYRFAAATASLRPIWKSNDDR